MASLYLLYGQGIGRGDLIAVLYWSFVAATLTLALVYLPVMFGLRRLLSGYRPLAAYPIVGFLLFVLPTAVIVGSFSTDLSGFLRSIASPESLLFYLMFLAFGGTFGLSFAWSFREPRSKNESPI